MTSASDGISDLVNVAESLASKMEKETKSSDGSKEVHPTTKLKKVNLDGFKKEEFPRNDQNSDKPVYRGISISEKIKEGFWSVYSSRYFLLMFVEMLMAGSIMRDVMSFDFVYLMLHLGVAILTVRVYILMKRKDVGCQIDGTLI